jgi:cysteine-rich repeat protein
VCGEEYNQQMIYDADQPIGDVIDASTPGLCDVGDVGIFVFDSQNLVRYWSCESISGAEIVKCKAGVLFCGDGQETDGEECDDGNTNDGDGCSAECLKEIPSAGVCGEEYNLQSIYDTDLPIGDAIDVTTDGLCDE